MTHKLLFNWDSEGIMITLKDGNQEISCKKVSWWSMHDIGTPDDHVFIDNGAPMHLCLLCGDAADSLNHINDDSVQTTLPPDVDELDMLLEQSGNVHEEAEDLPLHITDETSRE